MLAVVQMTYYQELKKIERSIIKHSRKVKFRYKEKERITKNVVRSFKKQSFLPGNSSILFSLKTKDVFYASKVLR